MDEFFEVGDRVQFKHHGYAAVGVVTANTNGNLYGGRLNIDYKIKVEKTMNPHSDLRYNTWVWHKDIVGKVFEG